MTARGRKRILLLSSLVLAVAAVQTVFVRMRVPEVEPAWYEEHAADLRTTVGRRIGYTWSSHGATLLRTESSRPLKGARSEELASKHPELRDAMETELAALPRKAVLEGLFYLAVAAVALPLVARTARRVAQRRNTDLWRAICWGLAVSVVAVLLLVPFLAFGYGASAYTNWVGPEALSATYLGPRFTGLQGTTISYRSAAEILLLLPSKTLDAVFPHGPLIGVATPVWIESVLILLRVEDTAYDWAEAAVFWISFVAHYFLLGVLLFFAQRVVGFGRGRAAT